MFHAPLPPQPPPPLPVQSQKESARCPDPGTAFSPLTVGPQQHSCNQDLCCWLDCSSWLKGVSRPPPGLDSQRQDKLWPALHGSLDCKGPAFRGRGQEGVHGGVDNRPLLAECHPGQRARQPHLGSEQQSVERPQARVISGSERYFCLHLTLAGGSCPGRSALTRMT